MQTGWGGLLPAARRPSGAILRVPPHHLLPPRNAALNKSTVPPTHHDCNSLLSFILSYLVPLHHLVQYRHQLALDLSSQHAPAGVLPPNLVC